MNHNTQDWLETLTEVDMAAWGTHFDPGAGQAPTSDPYAGAQPGMPGSAGPDPNAENQPKQPPEDITQDPQNPDMPEQEEDEDFESWRRKYFKATVKGDSNELIDILNEMRPAKGLRWSQKKFVKDNFDIQLLRQNSNIEKASKDIRKLLKDQIDQNNPAQSIVNHMYEVLETVPQLNEVYLKISGWGELKSALHRKFVAALLGAVQVGVGANTEDLIFNEREFSIHISTRMASEFGEIALANWSLKEDDAERFLAMAERKRLKDGSPQEKEVLRKRVVIESIADQFKTRAFIINVIGEDGTIYTLGWDITNALKNAYTDGKVIVRTRFSDNSEAMITDEGEIVPFVDLSILYVKDTGDQDEEGQPAKEEIEFLQRRNGRLYLTAELDTIKEAAKSLSGTTFQETPYRGNPSDLKNLQDCTYSAHEMLIGRQC